MIIYDDEKANTLKSMRGIDIDEIIELIIDKKFWIYWKIPKERASKYL